jgi:hypothetical protein
MVRLQSLELRKFKEENKMKNPNYAVIFTYSFDDDVAVYLFEDDKLAEEFLREAYEEELRIQVEENEWDAEGEIREDGWYAKITTHSDNHGDDVIEYRIGQIYQ